MTALNRRMPPRRPSPLTIAMHIAASTRAPAAPSETDAHEVPGALFAALVEPADDDMPDTESPRVRHAKAELRGVIADRVLKARLMNGYSQSEAAEMLQYGTTAQLSQWEQGRRPVPLTMLVRASEVFGVSMDWLCGISVEPDRDPRAARRIACTRAVRATLAASVERIVAAFDADEKVLSLNVAVVRGLAEAAQAVVALHGDFSVRHATLHTNEIARLAWAVGCLEDAAMKVGIALRRHDDEDALMRQRFAEAAANEAHA